MLRIKKYGDFYVNENYQNYHFYGAGINFCCQKYGQTLHKTTFDTLHLIIYLVFFFHQIINFLENILVYSTQFYQV